MYAKIYFFKGDYDNNQYPLKNCEVTLYTYNNGVYTIAKDVDNNDCIGETNNNGRCSFIVNDTNFDTGGTIKYFAKETRAPFGYKLLAGYHRVHPTPNQSDAMVTPMGVIMFDKIIIIPPKTGGWNEVLLNPYTGNAIAEIFWAGPGGPDNYFDRINWYYHDDYGHACTESGTYLPGHISHPVGDASVLVTEVALTWVDEHDRVTRTIPAGGNVPMQYMDIFNV